MQSDLLLSQIDCMKYAPDLFQGLPGVGERQHR
ncbi:unnamed protein product, partial [marine sediment metagenome]